MIRSDRSSERPVRAAFRGNRFRVVLALANARLTWRSLEQAWEAALEVTNLTDKLYYLTLFDQFASSGTVSGTPGEPCMWGLAIKRSF